MESRYALLLFPDGPYFCEVEEDGTSGQLVMYPTAHRCDLVEWEGLVSLSSTPSPSAGSEYKLIHLSTYKGLQAIFSDRRVLITSEILPMIGETSLSVIIYDEETEERLRVHTTQVTLIAPPIAEITQPPPKRLKLLQAQWMYYTVINHSHYPLAYRRVGDKRLRHVRAGWQKYETKVYEEYEGHYPTIPSYCLMRNYSNILTYKCQENKDYPGDPLIDSNRYLFWASREILKTNTYVNEEVKRINMHLLDPAPAASKIAKKGHLYMHSYADGMYVGLYGEHANGLWGTREVKRDFTSLRMVLDQKQPISREIKLDLSFSSDLPFNAQARSWSNHIELPVDKWMHEEHFSDILKVMLQPGPGDNQADLLHKELMKKVVETHDLHWLNSGLADVVKINKLVPICHYGLVESVDSQSMCVQVFPQGKSVEKVATVMWFKFFFTLGNLHTSFTRSFPLKATAADITAEAMTFAEESELSNSNNITFSSGALHLRYEWDGSAYGYFSVPWKVDSSLPVDYTLNGTKGNLPCRQTVDEHLIHHLDIHLRLRDAVELTIHLLTQQVFTRRVNTTNGFIPKETVQDFIASLSTTPASGFWDCEDEKWTGNDVNIAGYKHWIMFERTA